MSLFPARAITHSGPEKICWNLPSTFNQPAKNTYSICIYSIYIYIYNLSCSCRSNVYLFLHYPDLRMSSNDKIHSAQSWFPKLRNVRRISKKNLKTGKILCTTSDIKSVKGLADSKYININLPVSSFQKYFSNSSQE